MVLVLLINLELIKVLFGRSFLIGGCPQFLAVWAFQHCCLLFETNEGDSLLG